VVAAYIRFTGEAADEIVNNRGWIKLLLASVVIQVAFYLFDLYDLPAMRSYRQVLTNLAKALGVATALLMMLFYALPMLTLGRGGIPGQPRTRVCGSVFMASACVMDFGASPTWFARARVDSGIRQAGY
jgi:hypothetical protein